MKSMQEVLAEHQDWTDDYANKCSCRWQSYTEDAQTHQAEALAAAGYGPVREAQAQALRDAADELEYGNPVGSLLEERAAALANP